jgi:YbbR domain-containing protein
MNRPSQSNWFSALLALLFALLLFFNANSSSNSSVLVNTNQVYDEMLYNIPVQLEYDQDKYFVSGYEETVNVHLSSANRIQLNRESNEDTRNFQVVADLTKTPLGTSEIQLRVKGLSTAVTAEIEPKTITVTLENKVTQSFEVQAQLPDTIEAEGYTVKKTELSPKKVDITTGEETAKAIERVIAPLSNVKQSVDTIKQTVNVQALDNKGQVLSIENPAPQVKVVVELSLPSKEVSLTATATGSPPSGVSNYTFSLSKQKAEIKGSKSILDGIDTIEVPIDINNVKSSVKKKVKLPTSSDYIITPEEVEVTINPIFAETSTSYSDVSGGQNTTGTFFSQETPVPSSSSEVTSSSSSTSTSSSVPKVDSTTDNQEEDSGASKPAN